MCGRFAFHSPRETVRELFDVDLPIDWRPRFNIAPSQDIFTLRFETEAAAPAMLRWGLVPFWAKDPSIGHRMINARAETVADKPSFRVPYRKRRCAILADGFYEWSASPSGKQPYYIRPADGGPFAMAGLWDRWPRDDWRIESCTILTTAASAQLANLHDRMPVILDRADIAAWIDPATSARRLAELTAGPAPEFDFRPVARTVNNPANDGPELLESV